MKKLALLLLLLLVCGSTFVKADDITFSFIESGNVPNLTSSPSGLTAGPAALIAVSDTAKGLEFPLSGDVNASTGTASSITVTPTSYVATYTAGGDVTIFQGATPLLTGSPMFNRSNLSSNLTEDTGSFQGQFTVTSVNPAVLAKFGLGPAFKPDGSIGITFAASDVTGGNLTAVIGGGSVTIETPTVVPEAASLLYFGMAALIVAWYRRKQESRLG